MEFRLLKSIATAIAISCTASAPALAGDRHHGKHVFNDYARVIHVEPKYRVVTRRVPQRTCDVPHRQQRHLGHQGHRNHQQPRPEAVFISGVIGGAIGHQLSRSVNGKSHPGAVITGAAIGAGLAASHQQHGGGHHISHSNSRQHRRKPHCTTTTHVQQVRQADGYLVTYRFRGQQFTTHTNYHPGDRIAVRVALSTSH